MKIRYWLTKGRDPEQEVTRDEWQAAKHGGECEIPERAGSWTVKDVSGRLEYELTP